MTWSRIAVAVGLISLLVIGCAPDKPAAGNSGDQPPPGAIWFGPNLVGTTMPSHADFFPAKTPFGWLAVFTTAPGTTSIELDVDSVASAGPNTPLTTVPATLDNAQETVIAHPADLSLSSYGPGTFRLRIVANGTLIAAGTFTVAP